ncbi:hypothetical protein SAMN04487947_0512 [Halogeometricum rufum]|jgi:hypothetical protein|uniref:Uncharacterized protein n=1 Tax=Halogeometricum rufum TaxID=553469 RepID=A0A1I6G3I6_9EURY|nr:MULTISPECIES: hypothetical protein [Halogeometricum]MUV58322.1 hypothetical protein [Halogeometricum sp. CBA1124]SFR36778.1 hypothetical protein SAMN04487947_0512 [Halogeometricum rufum]
MHKIVYETDTGTEESENVVAYDERGDYWVVAPDGEDADLRRRIPGSRVYFVESDDESPVGTW